MLRSRAAADDAQEPHPATAVNVVKRRVGGDGLPRELELPRPSGECAGAWLMVAGAGAGAKLMTARRVAWLAPVAAPAKICAILGSSCGAVRATRRFGSTGSRRDRVAICVPDRRQPRPPSCRRRFVWPLLRARMSMCRAHRKLHCTPRRRRPLQRSAARCCRSAIRRGRHVRPPTAMGEPDQLTWKLTRKLPEAAP